MLLPALVAPVLDKLAAHTDPEHTDTAHRHLVALAGRMLCDGGWTEQQRHAGAEALATGRTRPYDESTVRKAARALSAQGAVAHAEALLLRQVQCAVGKASVEAFTDIFDQVYWTKKPAWAAPVGNLGNRLLACTYFGLTFVRAEHTPCFALHVSWHKPGTPLIEALHALHEDKARQRWLTARVRLHVLDRGTQGHPALSWLLEQGVPYLTPTNGSPNWRRFRHPDLRTAQGVPIFVRPDEGLKDTPIGEQGQAVEPRTIVFPAQPQQGTECGRAVRYRTAAALSDEQIETLDEQYKRRWPNNESAIKDLLAVGFGRNLDRTLELTTSRGHDGKVMRLEKAIEGHRRTQDELAASDEKKAHRQAAAEEKKRQEKEKKLRAVQNAPEQMGARADVGAEHLCKVLKLLLWNAVAMLLWRSPMSSVQTMTIGRACALLLEQKALAVMTAGRLVLWVEATPVAAEQEEQREVARLVNEAGLRVRGVELGVRIRDPAGEQELLRVSA